MIDFLTSDEFLGLLGISVIAAVGMNLVYITGQLNLGQAGFYGIGAYTAAWLDVHLGLPLPLLLIGAAVIAGAIALPISFGVRRLGGVYLIMGTLAVGELVRLSLSNFEFLGARRGFQTESGVGLVAILAVASIVVICAVILMRSRVGLQMRSLFDDRDAAAAAGVAVGRIKTLAVVISASVVGVAGGMWAMWIQKIEPRDFMLDRSFEIALYTLIGGVHSLLGAIAGAVTIEVLTGTGMADLVGAWRFVAYGLVVMLLVPLAPEGIVSRATALRLTRPFKRRQAIAAGWAGAATPSPARTVLEVRRVSHRYDGVIALDDVSLDVAAGEVLALMGANGAGKSTLIDVVSGRLSLQSGTVTLLARRLDGLTADRRSRLGLGRTFQDVRTFAHLTVAESLQLGAAGEMSDGEIAGVLEWCGLERHRDHLPDVLTPAEQRRLEIARAVVLRPTVLLLDEPSVGMTDDERRELAALIASLREGGIAIVVVDHNLDLALGVADRVAVLDFGEVIAEGSPEAVLDNPRVQAAYLGHVDPADLDGAGQ